MTEWRDGMPFSVAVPGVAATGSLYWLDGVPMLTSAGSTTGPPKGTLTGVLP